MRVVGAVVPRVVGTQVGSAGSGAGGALAAPAAGIVPLSTAGRGRERAPRQAEPGKDTLRVAQFNILNFFDTVDDPKTSDQVATEADYKVKLAKLSLAIREQLGSPDILSLNEIENEQVLKDLLDLPEMKKLGYKTVVGELNDRRGIRNGMLYRAEKLEVEKVEEFNPDVKLSDPARGQVDPGKLYARAPLVVDFRLRGAAQAAEGAGLLTVIGNHFKSKLGGDGPEVRRVAQGEYLGGFVDARRAASPNTGIIVLGDLNALYEDGAFKKLARREDGSERLYDAPMKVPQAQRYSYNYRGQHNMLDHLMVTEDIKGALKEARIPHFNTHDGAKGKRLDPKIADGVSDHDPLIADFDLSKLLAARAAATPAAA